MFANTSLGKLLVFLGTTKHTAPDTCTRAFQKKLQYQEIAVCFPAAPRRHSWFPLLDSLVAPVYGVLHFFLQNCIRNDQAQPAVFSFSTSWLRMLQCLRLEMHVVVFSKFISPVNQNSKMCFQAKRMKSKYWVPTVNQALISLLCM